MRFRLRRFFPLVFALGAGSLQGAPVLSEFMAINSTGIRDSDGRASDWIELSNPAEEPLSLAGWFLSDNPERPRKWALPAISLQPGERRLVFASGHDRTEGEWHANFRLAAVGGYLSLTGPDGSIASAFPYPPQFQDLSFGLAPGGEPGFLAAPSPGAENAPLAQPGPVLSELAHAPERPEPGENITVTARVTPRAAAVTSVTLFYRALFKGESRTAMRDDGQGADAAAGDGIYTGVVPGRSLFGPIYRAGEMMRWRVTAEDAEANISTDPPYLDVTGTRQSPQYHGTVARHTEEDSGLPVFYWFTENEAGARSRAGARAAVFYAGRFYDNVFVRQRGGATNGRSQKADFNRAHPFYINEEMPAVAEINLNAEGSDPSYLRQTLAFDTFTLAGNAACSSFLLRMHLNGALDRIGVLIEQVDEDFLERRGYDPEGDLYKLVQRSNLDPVFNDTTTGVEKKTGNLTDFSSLQAFVDGLNQEDPALRKAFLFDRLDVPQVLNYLAVRSVNQDADDVRKNFYVYQDTHGTGEWSIFPWDKDWTYGVTGDGGTFLKHPFFGDKAHLKQNANQWNVLYDAVFNESTLRLMYLRRLRTVMDALLQPPGTPAGSGLFEQRADALLAAAEEDLPASAPGATRSMKNFFPERRTDLYVTYGPGGREPLVPAAQPEQPEMRFGSIDYSPASGNQDEEFIELVNPNAFAVDLSGWRLEGGVEFVFRPGTVVPADSLFAPGRNRILLSPDVTAFRARASSPRGGEGRFVQGPYRGHLSSFGESLQLLDAGGRLIAETTYEGQPSDPQRFLVLSELHYHPADPHEDAEFLELLNVSTDTAVDLTGVRFTQGVDFQFPDGYLLDPGARAVVVRDPAAFATLYGDRVAVAGAFAGTTALSNGGETLKLEDASGGTILQLDYDDEEPWPVEADGAGYSLVLIDPASRPDPDDPASWRLSARPGGSPGAPDDDSGGGFTGDPQADSNGDGYTDFVHYALAGDGPLRFPVLLHDASGPLFRVPRNAAAPDVAFSVEESPDLRSWSEIPGAFTWPPAEEIVDGVAILTWRPDAATPFPGPYLRLKIRWQPTP